MSAVAGATTSETVLLHTLAGEMILLLLTTVSGFGVVVSVEKTGAGYQRISRTVICMVALLMVAIWKESSEVGFCCQDAAAVGSGAAAESWPFIGESMRKQLSAMSLFGPV